MRVSGGGSPVCDQCHQCSTILHLYLLQRRFVSAFVCSCVHQHAFDIDIDYILVVGHFGLATGSGGITQSNMHNESCPKPFTPR